MGNGVYLSRSQTSSEDSTARKKFTISGWYKLGSNGDAGGWKGFWSAATDGSNYSSLKQNADGYIIFEQKSSGTGVSWTSTSKYRDYSSWYHIMVAYDSTQASNTDRVKVYINGSIAPGTHGSFTQDQEGFWGNSASTAGVGRYNNNTGSSYMYTGYMTHVVCTIGYALAPTVFGETDSTTGEWKPKTSPSGITYSANGFYLKFENSGAMGTDSSGNSNTFTVNGTGGTDGSLVQTTDVPSNNFATLNPLANGTQASYSQGNLDEACNDNYGVGATMAFANGKWYWEIKITAGDNNLVGIANSDEQGRLSTQFGINNYSITAYGVNGQITKEGSVVETVSNTFGANDIVGIAVDMDSGTRTVQFYKNGSTFGSAVTLPTNWGFTVPIIRKGGSSQTSSFNFGNPQFSITSGNADANSYGNFEYAVPSGHYALCTENLNTYG